MNEVEAIQALTNTIEVCLLVNALALGVIVLVLSVK